MLKIHFDKHSHYLWLSLTVAGTIALISSLVLLVFIITKVSTSTHTTLQITGQQQDTINQALDLFNSTREFD